jgi:phenylpyruvate tautomerase PptA (4-oxalocrotonate tautomerase family)
MDQYNKEYQGQEEEEMPFISSKVNIVMTEEQKDTIRKRLGENISIIPGKTEDWLMVEIEDHCDLYFRGDKKQPTAFIEVKVFGEIRDTAARKMTEIVSGIYEKELGIKQNRIYIKYEEARKWGWNGTNF